MFRALRNYQKCITFIVAFLFTPCFYVFEMSFVRPTLVEEYHIGTTKHYAHVFFSTLCFINVVGNMLLSIITDPKLKKSLKDGVYCTICKMYRPEGSWHCTTCNACIVRRDHHCLFLSRCIGLDNQRYFIQFLFHVTVSMMYACYYNYYYVSLFFRDKSMFISALRILNPIVRYMVPEPIDVGDFLMLLLFLNVGILGWSTFLFSCHMRNVLRGITSYESKASQGDLANWKENFVNVFGEKWFLAVIFPFIYSPLPEITKIH